MRDTDYGQVNTVVRIHENYLLDEAQLLRMLEANDYNQALRLLSDTQYRPGIESAIETQDYEPMLMHRLEETASWLLKDIPNPQLSELLTLQYMYHNIKVLFKEKGAGKTHRRPLIRISYFPSEVLKEAVDTLESDVLPEVYIENIRQMDNYYRDIQNINDLDVYIDRIYQEHLILLASQIEDPAVLDYYQRQVDYNNLRTFFRGLSLGRTANHLTAVLSEAGTVPIDTYIDAMEGGIQGAVEDLKKHARFEEVFNQLNTHRELSISELERAIDNQLARELEVAKMQVFGPLPVIAYVNALETEVINIRLILTSKLNSIDPDRVKKRMRWSYAI